MVRVDGRSLGWRIRGARPSKLREQRRVGTASGGHRLHKLAITEKTFVQYASEMGSGGTAEVSIER